MVNGDYIGYVKFGGGEIKKYEWGVGSGLPSHQILYIPVITVPLTDHCGLKQVDLKSQTYIDGYFSLVDNSSLTLITAMYFCSGTY